MTQLKTSNFHHSQHFVNCFLHTKWNVVEIIVNLRPKTASPNTRTNKVFNYLRFQEVEGKMGKLIIIKKTHSCLRMNHCSTTANYNEFAHFRYLKIDELIIRAIC